MATTHEELTMTRILSAPRSAVFKAWIDADTLSLWWGPRGFSNPVCEIEARPGGQIRIDMQSPDGTIYPMKGVYQEINEPARIVMMTSALEDESGNPQLAVLHTISFAEIKGRTGLTLQSHVIKATPAAAQALQGMAEGWNQSLERLADVLSASEDV